MKSFLIRRFMKIMCAASAIVLPTQVLASAFQLWEQDGASIGSYHAGYAALANDASTAFYNPAGIIRINNQQAVFGTAYVVTDLKFVGSVTGDAFEADEQTTTAQGGMSAFVPNLHYVAPINDSLGVGLSVVVPFGLATNYGYDTFMRYAATKTSVNVIDISPALGFALNNKFSIGAGLDIQRMFAEFNLVGAFSTTQNDTTSINKANDTAYGYHLGALYQFTQNSRFGISYHSQVTHHLTGSSYFSGPLASGVVTPSNAVISSRATTNVTLPAYTALSGYHKFSDKVALMGSAIYTQWSVFKELRLNGLSGIPFGGFTPTTNLTVSIPEHYRDTWNLSLGSEYYATDTITLRVAVGYDQTPVRNQYRTPQMPDNDRYVIAFGGHYQATKAIGLDLGWTHFFIQQSHVQPPPLQVGAEQVIVSGRVDGGADVYGAQITWNMT